MKHIIFCLVVLGAATIVQIEGADSKDNRDTKADLNLDFSAVHEKALWSPGRCNFLFVLYRWWFVITPQMFMRFPCEWFIMPLAFKCTGVANIELETITEKEKTYFSIRRTTDKRFKGFKCIKKYYKP